MQMKGWKGSSGKLDSSELKLPATAGGGGDSTTDRPKLLVEDTVRIANLQMTHQLTQYMLLYVLSD